MSRAEEERGPVRSALLRVADSTPLMLVVCGLVVGNTVAASLSDNDRFFLGMVAFAILLMVVMFMLMYVMIQEIQKSVSNREEE